MTPYNLVQMAKLLELDAIALTDHNTVGNCRSAVQAGKQAGITVLPGMELCTSEEIHVVCLFADLDTAEEFGWYVAGCLPLVKNKPHIFGEQRLMDHQDTVLGLEEILLVTASGISIEEIRGICATYGGICYPAHIDRASFSILSSLGVFPPHLGFTCVEVTPQGDLQALRTEHSAVQGLHIMRSSDAHYLENISDQPDLLEVEENTAQAILNSLAGFGREQ